MTAIIRLFAAVCRRLPVCLSVLTVLSAGAASLPPDIQKLVKRYHMRPDKIGIIIQRFGEDHPLLSYQADKTFNPASVVKLFTTSAAVDLLGPKHRWQTAFAHSGTINDGVLQGDLHIVGGGDPQITLEKFLLFLHDLRNRGLHKIEGWLIIDNTFFSLPRHAAAAFDGAPLKPYNASASALAVNYNAQQVVLLPRDGSIHAYVEPPNDNFVIDNRLRAGKGRCASWRKKIRERYSGDKNRMTLSLKGPFPPRCGRQSFYVSALSHEANVAGVFGALWRRLGGGWTGEWQVGLTPPTAATLSVFESPPLSQVIAGMNKFSNNVIARNLFLSLAAAESVPPYTLAAARAAFQRWAVRQGFGGGGFFVDNGSGLSRHTRVRAAQLAALLRHMWTHPLRAEMVASLPILGVDGTLSKRLPAAGTQGHLKTGSLVSTKAIAGFLRDAAGRDVLFICLTEGQHSGRAKKFQDSLIEWARRQP